MEIYYCQKCNQEMESLAKKKFAEQFEQVENVYKAALAQYLKSNYNFIWIYVFLNIKCPCSFTTKAVFYSRFHEDGVKKEDFKIVHINNTTFLNISGLLSREECRKTLEKLILRWNNHTLQTILASPFIGPPDAKLKDWNWVEKFYSPFRTIIITREDSAKSFQNLIVKDDNLNLDFLCTREEFGKVLILANEIYINNRFHAKFYAGVYHEEVEVVETSFNIFEPGPDILENFSMRSYPVDYFQKRFLIPLGIDKIRVAPEAKLEMTEKVPVLIIKEEDSGLNGSIDYCTINKWEFISKYI